MSQPAPILTDPTALRELDASVERIVFGNDLSVPRARALAILGATYATVTGPTFKLNVHGHELSVPMPDGETIGGHPGDDNWNQRYFRYAAQHVLDFPNEIGEHAARDLASIRGATRPFSSDWSAIRLVEDEIERRGLGRAYANALSNEMWPTLPKDHADDSWWTIKPGSVFNLLRASCEARCRAALAVCEDTP